MILREPYEAQEKVFDLIVIGGGVYGACLALEAARRGLSPLLIEQGDFGGATSWNSLKIVHGGLRYLQNGDIRRSLESVRERGWFLRHFPDLVVPISCLMPLYGRGLKRASILRLALIFNDCLSAGRNRYLSEKQAIDRGRVIDPLEAIRLFPGVNKMHLQGAAVWHDAIMRNSQRLMIEILRWACNAGATCVNYVRAESLSVSADTGAVSGVEAIDLPTRQRLEYRAPTVINCAGRWCRTVAEAFDRDVAGLFYPSLAFNLLLDRPPLSESALAVSPRDSQSPAYFLVPWKGKMLAGTCHAPVQSHSRNEGPARGLIRKFLDDLGECVPKFNLDFKDILRVFWGLLPAANEGSSELATREKIYDHGVNGGPKGLFSVSGVKFTTARRVAQKSLRVVFRAGKRSLPALRPAARPQSVPWMSWSEFQHSARSDKSAAVGYLNRLVNEESVLYLDDLLLRRSNWVEDPTCYQEACETVGLMLDGLDNAIPRQNREPFKLEMRP